MSLISRRHLFSLVLVLLLLSISAVLYFRLIHADSNALWRIISQQCIPGEKQSGNPAPCSQVDLAAGNVTMKDRNGPLQYLLMPVARISGIESPILLSPNIPNFFQQAWQAKSFMMQRYGAVIPDSAISLSLNSEYGRSQNQLHIHISCWSPEVLKKIDSLSLSQQWQPVPDGLKGHDYQIRSVSAAQLNSPGLITLLAESSAEARKDMGAYSLAMGKKEGGDFFMLMTRRSLWPFNLASAEELQDHNCPQLNWPSPSGITLTSVIDSH